MASLGTAISTSTKKFEKTHTSGGGDPIFLLYTCPDNAQAYVTMFSHTNYVLTYRRRRVLGPTTIGDQDTTFNASLGNTAVGGSAVVNMPLSIFGRDFDEDQARTGNEDPKSIVLGPGDRILMNSSSTSGSFVLHLIELK